MGLIRSTKLIDINQNLFSLSSLLNLKNSYLCKSICCIKQRKPVRHNLAGFKAVGVFMWGEPWSGICTDALSQGPIQHPDALLSLCLEQTVLPVWAMFAMSF